MSATSKAPERMCDHELIAKCPPDKEAMHILGNISFIAEFFSTPTDANTDRIFDQCFAYPLHSLVKVSLANETGLEQADVYSEERPSL